MKKSILITVVFFIFSGFAFGQDWQTVYNNTNSLLDKGKYKEAKPSAELLLRAAEEEFGKEDLNYAVSLATLYEIHYYLGEYEQAISLAEEEITVLRELLDEEDNRYAEAVSNLAIFYNAGGYYDKAEPLYQKALSLRRNIFAEDSPYLASSINNLGLFYDRRAQYDKAEPLLKEALAMYRRLYDDNNAHLATSINNMAFFYTKRAMYDKAEPLLLEALDMRRKIFKGDNPELALSLNNLAVFYDMQGRFSKAEPLYNEAYEMRSRLYENNHPSLAKSLNALAYYYEGQGDYAKAENYFKSALNIYREIYHKAHPETAVVLSNIAYFYDKRGRTKEAKPFYNEALKMYREIYAEDHPELAVMLNNSAIFCARNDDSPLALKLINEALQMTERLYPDKNHPDYATVVKNMGEINHIVGKDSLAENYFLLSHDTYCRLFKDAHPEKAASALRLGEYYLSQDMLENAGDFLQTALEIYDSLFTNQHPEYIKAQYSMARYYEAVGNISEAFSTYSEALTAYYGISVNYFSALSEREKAQFWKTMRSNFEYYYSFVFRHHKSLPELEQSMLNYSALTKGLIFLSTKQLRNRIATNKDSSGTAQFNHWTDLREQICRYFIMPEKILHQNNIDRDSLLNLANDLEKKLSERYLKNSTAGLTAADLSSIQQKLLPNTALVDIVRFNYYNQQQTDSVVYAYIIIKPEEMTVEYINNGTALEQEDAVLYQQQIDKQRKRYFDTEQLALHMKELFIYYWKPVNKHLKGVNTVYVIPDGIYNKINLNTLINPETNKYLIEEIDIRYITGIADILHNNNIHTQNNKTAVLIGDPSFNLDSTQRVKHVNALSYDLTRSITNLDSLTRAGISPLPGTKKEIDNISELLENNKWNVEKYLGDNALEEVLKRTASPELLHIATHSVFLNNIERNNSRLGFRRDLLEDNPLLRSMLFLAGAENSLKSKLDGKPLPENLEDGLLTAYEASNLDLYGTDMVVLSACETGLGEVENGEGVYGLQRAFRTAGANSLIMSLWSVNDSATELLMTSFYKKFLNGKSKRQAFREAQLELKEQSPGFYYWGAFIMMGN